MTAPPQVSPPEPLAADFPPARLEDWRALIDKALKGDDFERRLVALTADALRIQPLFTTRPEPLTGAVTVAPSHRAPDGRGWDIRQRQVGNDPSLVNAAILEDLAGGASSVVLQMAAPGQWGLPCTDSAMADALAGVLLDVCPIALDAGDNAVAAAQCLTRVWLSQGLDATQRCGAFNADPLGTLAATGAIGVPLPHALEAAIDLVRETLAWPNVTALRADGQIWHAAGASEAQELAAILATVVAYLRAAETAGVTPDALLPKIVVNLAIDADQLLGLAKVRAARIVLTRVAEACGMPNVASRIAITAETAASMMTRRDPWVNMLRTTMACATAAMGGASSITVLPFSWALGQPDAFARRMARNASLVLMEESGLGRVADPASGSFAIETLTADLAAAAWAQFQALEADGGMAAALISGRWQAALAETAANKRQAVATGRVPLTGVSAFPRLGDDGVTFKPWPRPDPAVRLPGGTCITPLAPFRPSAPFDALRDAADAMAIRTGQPPRVLLVCLGPLASHAARATWMSNFLASGGIKGVQSAPINQMADAGQAIAAGGATVACLCGTDASYAELGVATVALLKISGARAIYLAGRPRELEVALKAAGLDGFIHAGGDSVATLAALHAALGVAGDSA